ncbi:MAG: hypothetical protein DWQ47_00630 [Acidobacteria bacterium]|nr:MAG: hypothetical protein DWQ32_11090 [Acidobacteriota bacterium]REK04015.1 MAG: hypothetical protein DWQ38_00615 [Acidobacteriota bacterium]REK15177.1 MAG: hypothetical protein DWQ43_16780 [Acidobacteriota bacterium]REK46267.1 MAG: hypothetical protein DWQ47_00630 [Acidobacteriota bacterium]
MRVKVLFFGATADEAGTNEAEIELNRPSTSESAFEAILAKFPALTTNRKPEDLLFAVNQEYVAGGESIAEDDVLAVFTAVSGG